MASKIKLTAPAHTPSPMQRITSALKTGLRRIWTLGERVKVPTYQKDVVGEVRQWDERDVIFSRRDLFRYFGVDSPQYEAYYAAHPEHLEYDARTATMPELGRTGGIDQAMFEAQFAALDQISPDAFVDGEPAPEKTAIPPKSASEKIKALARLLGADLVGIGPLNQAWVYSHVARSFGDQEGYQPWGTPIDLGHHTHAIALGFGMDFDLIQHAPDFPVLLATAKGYASGAWVSIQLALYLRMLGYAARAHHFHNYQVLCVPVAVDCGLGELSRAGYLLNKDYGLGLRLAIVTTNMPLAPDKPVNIGVQSFCETCKVCAESCPVGAIPLGDKVESNGVKKWKLDEESCYRYWHAAGTDCGICMAACPWTKRLDWLHKSVANIARVKGPHQAMLTKLDKRIYGPHTTQPRPAYIDEFVPREHNSEK